MTWWMWTVVGFALLLVEVATPGTFFFLFFGIAGLIVAASVGLGPAQPLWLQCTGFAASATLMLLLFRRRLRADPTPRPPFDTLAGEVATLGPTPLAPGQVGQVTLRGTVWQAQNSGSAPLPAGSRARVVHVDGLTLRLQALDPKEP